MAQKVGVICKNCRQGIEIDDEYIPGLPAASIAVTLYKAVAERFADPVDAGWRKILTCGHPHCGKTHEYTGGDLLLYDER